MTRPRGADRAHPDQLDLFNVEPLLSARQRLDAREWPSAQRWPVNRASTHVRDVLWADLTAAANPLLVAGYSSIAEIVELVGDWLGQQDDDRIGRVRIVLGTEPHMTQRREFISAAGNKFTEEVERYWLEDRGVSLRLSARVIQVIDALDRGALSVRQYPGPPPLHSKIYIGHGAATIGSSNFTAHGLGGQIEANARFEARSERRRHDELVGLAENLWETGQPFDRELRALLHALLQVVDWKEALARAVAELLEGDWAAPYIPATHTSAGELWPSQRAGIAQALWVINEVGSVLVADATGSGKTRMGAHLAQAIRNRLWLTGRVRRDVVLLICPPAVERTWAREALIAGTSLVTHSHGRLSRQSGDGTRDQELAVVDRSRFGGHRGSCPIRREFH